MHLSSVEGCARASFLELTCCAVLFSQNQSLVYRRHTNVCLMIRNLLESWNQAEELWFVSIHRKLFMMTSSLCVNIDCVAVRAWNWMMSGSLMSYTGMYGCWLLALISIKTSGYNLSRNPSAKTNVSVSLHCRASVSNCPFQASTLYSMKNQAYVCLLLSGFEVTDLSPSRWPNIKEVSKLGQGLP